MSTVSSPATFVDPNGHFWDRKSVEDLSAWHDDHTGRLTDDEIDAIAEREEEIRKPAYDGNDNGANEQLAGLDTPAARRYVAHRLLQLDDRFIETVINEPYLVASHPNIVREMYPAELERRRKQREAMDAIHNEIIALPAIDATGIGYMRNMQIHNETNRLHQEWLQARKGVAL